MCELQTSLQNQREMQTQPKRETLWIAQMTMNTDVFRGHTWTRYLCIHLCDSKLLIKYPEHQNSCVLELDKRDLSRCSTAHFQWLTLFEVLGLWTQLLSGWVEWLFVWHSWPPSALQLPQLCFRTLQPEICFFPQTFSFLSFNISNSCYLKHAG